ncbi:MAG TPA: helix-turn-helix transcriptional regulator [Paraburkholderia sp.]|jgi:DNA-binding NarL/FixJ family response regulator|uniref:helix-turn-helix transcriptional regulator n=1 Tax=Paraburkholderia sp. TaxID=1926495 RepID=UPI002B4728E3|nr:helix-turn-helix transcriptional regulator [Paraburkholderia sp.]HKR42146.1 helix-turn-helix transcriptional regulator [Paraburkholderia sp.]
MDLTSRELALIADVFKLLADHILPEGALRLEVGRRLLELLRADGLHAGADLFVWSGEVHLDHLRIGRGKRREHFSDRELVLFDLVRPAFIAALARSRAQTGYVQSVPEDTSTVDNEAISRLTRRERDVVALVVEGLLDKEIAERLGISYTTVRTHLDRSFQKLGVSNRSRLARLVQSTQR